MIGLHHMEDGKRLCQNAKPSDVQSLAYSTWRARLRPVLKAGVSAPKKFKELREWGSRVAAANGRAPRALP